MKIEAEIGSAYRSPARSGEWPRIVILRRTKVSTGNHRWF